MVAQAHHENCPPKKWITVALRHRHGHLPPPASPHLPGAGPGVGECGSAPPPTHPHTCIRAPTPPAHTSQPPARSPQPAARTPTPHPPAPTGFQATPGPLSLPKQAQSLPKRAQSLLDPYSQPTRASSPLSNLSPHASFRLAPPACANAQPPTAYPGHLRLRYRCRHPWPLRPPPARNRAQSEPAPSGLPGRRPRATAPKCEPCAS